MLKNILNTLFKPLIVLFLLTLLSGCVSAPNILIPPVPPKPRAIVHQPRVAIVLGGGGAKGYAHIGVLRELQKAGVPIDLVVGSSAGALVGALYADRGREEDAEYALMKARFFDFVDINSHPWSGGFLTGNAFQWFVLRHMRAQQFKDTHIPLVVVATDLARGKPYVIASGPIPPAVTASAAVPGGVIPVRMYGKTLVDGAMVAPVPVNVALRYHPKVIIAVNICNDLYPKLPWTAYYTYYRAYQISWNQLAKQTEMGADVVIHPAVGQTGIFDLGSKQTMFDEGVAAADKALPRIKRLLALRGIALQRLAPTGSVANTKQPNQSRLKIAASN